MAIKIPRIPLIISTIILISSSLGQLSHRDITRSTTDLFDQFSDSFIKLTKQKGMTINERAKRLTIFAKNLIAINKFEPPPKDKHGRNLLGSVAASFRKGINKFAFLSPEEFEARFLIPNNVLFRKTAGQSRRDDPAQSFDTFLRQQDFAPNVSISTVTRNQTRSRISFFGGRFLEASQGSPSNEASKTNSSANLNPTQARILQSTKLTGVKDVISWDQHFGPVFDQKDCNSCYISGTLDALEAVHNIKHGGAKVDLSTQEILDCSSENFECTGGQPSAVLEYVKHYGIAFDTDYRYEAQKIHCRANLTANQKRSQIRNRELSAVADGQIGSLRFSGGLGFGRILQRNRNQFGSFQYTNFNSNVRLNNYSRPQINYNRSVKWNFMGNIDIILSG